MFTKYVLAASGGRRADVRGLHGRAGARAAAAVAADRRAADACPTCVRSIAGAGLVEAQRENIPIGVNVPGVVYEVFVKKGDMVKAGDPLFRVDDRELKAELKVPRGRARLGQGAAPQAQGGPRPEDIPPAEAAVEEAKAKLNDAEAAMARTERLYNRQMAPPATTTRTATPSTPPRPPWPRRRRPRADQGGHLEGRHRGRPGRRRAWPRARSRASRSTSNGSPSARLTDGEVLQLNVRLGQFAAMTWKEPMIVLGDVKRLHVRVDIDENDLPLFDKKRRGRRHAQGAAAGALPARVRLRRALRHPQEEPDRRQLRAGRHPGPPGRSTRCPTSGRSDVYVGQQMDVYLKAADEPKGVALDPDVPSPLPYEPEERPAGKAGLKHAHSPGR